MIILYKILQKISVTASPKIQVITLDSMEDGSIEYQLTFGLASTTTLTLNEEADSMSIEVALNNLKTIKAIGEVKVDMKRIDEEIELTIYFVSTATDLGDIIVTGYSNYTSENIQSYEFSSTETFMISHGSSRTTALVNASSTGDDIEAELYKLYTTECTVSSEGNVFFYNGFEESLSTTFSGSRDNFVEPYCGRYSHKNPRSLYRDISSFPIFTATIFSNRYVSTTQHSEYDYMYMCDACIVVFYFTSIIIFSFIIHRVVFMSEEQYQIHEC